MVEYAWHFCTSQELTLYNRPDVEIFVFVSWRKVYGPPFAPWMERCSIPHCLMTVHLPSLDPSLSDCIWIPGGSILFRRLASELSEQNGRMGVC